MKAKYYVKVLVADSSFHGSDALTYSSDKPLEVGHLVVVPLRNKFVTGIVAAKTPKPTFSVKSVHDIYDLPALPKTTLALIDWMKEYYPAPLGVITQLFLAQSLPKSIELSGDDEQQHTAPLQPPLTDDQKKAVDKISGPGLHILHGETGTGKTRVYIELIKKAFEDGRSAMVLTPEIGLTSQLINSLKEVFGQNVELLHSNLTPKTRKKAWANILRREKPVVIVGPRSALFCPLDNIGLIVVDESHETAYKQDNAPYYQTSHVAAKLASLHDATLVLGSSTPSIGDYLVAQTKGRPIVRMRQTATKSATTDEYTHQVVDLRDRSNLSGNTHLSKALIEQIKLTLSRDEQVLLFLNRRGTARLVFCEQCGWQATCPRCDLPLVYHGDTHSLQCHTCSYNTTSFVSCPDCGNPTIVFKSAGTKAVTEQVLKLFPEAKIQRFDTDNKSHEKMEKHFEALQRGDIDIIIGTQMLGKGIDLPKLSLVGVILADSSLSFPDFSAQERTYQILRQVVGRAGRGHRKGHAVIQTYNPDSRLLEAALSKDWDTFYLEELEERKKFRFPPYYYLLKLSCRRASSSAASRASENLTNSLKKLDADIIIEGPTPSFYEKVGGKYQWQLIIKSKRRGELLKVINNLPANWSYDIDPLNLL